MIEGTGFIDVTLLDERHFFVESEMYPDAFPGSAWVVPGNGILLGRDSFIVQHKGFGTGDLAGGEIRFTVRPILDLDTIILPCEPAGDRPVVELKGQIVFPSR
jgi:hypothetical protein